MVAYCGSKVVAPGTVCSDGTVATWGRNGTGGASNIPKKEPAAESVVSEAVSWNTNTSPVPFKTVAEKTATYSGGIPGPSAREVIPFNEAMNYVNELRGKSVSGSKEDKKRWNNLLSDLRRYTGSKLGTQGSVESAFKMVLEDAQASGEDVLNLLSKGPGLAGKAGGSGDGPTVQRNVTIQAESDIDATANAIALELLGRPLDQKEIDKVVGRIRRAETEMPTVTTYNSGGSITEQGLTAQGRDDILRELIAQNPEYEQFQVDTTVLDAMTGFIDRKKEISGG